MYLSLRQPEPLSEASGEPRVHGVPSVLWVDRLGCPQVLFCYEQFDELTLLHLREFDKKKLISVETDIVVDHYKEEKFEDTSPGDSHLSLGYGPM